MSKQNSMPFGLTWPQKIMGMAGPVLLAIIVSMASSFLPEPWRTVFVIATALVLAVITWFVSAGWNFRMDLGPNELQIREPRRQVNIPMDRIGILVRRGGLWPSLLLVLRAAGVGSDVPVRGLDLQAREMIENYQRRNPGKKITVVAVPLAYIRSVPELVAELRRRIPPLGVDTRLGAK